MTFAGNENLRVQRATDHPHPEELQHSVLELLRAHDLPTEGVLDQFPQSYWVVHHGEALVAVAGVEQYGDPSEDAGYGLLRSVAVARSHTNQGLGAALVRHVLTECMKPTGFHRTFLLTTTAAPFFAKLGFSEVPRTEVPEAVRAAPEFTSICPDSATCMGFPA